MIARLAAATAAMALVSGCGQGGGGGDVALENVSVGEAAQRAQTANRLTPGEWETSVQIVSAEMPGAPPEVAAALGEAAGSQSARGQACITPEQAARPQAELFTGSGSGNCRYETFTMANGRIDAVMVCAPRRGQAGAMRMTMGGTYGAERYDLDMSMNVGAVPGLPAGQTMVMQAKASGRRIGACAATPAKAG